MTVATAEVEVLTAEVRVLMVGSRQVTLSVYRQLDTVWPSEIEPFGRVRDSKDSHDLAIVGSDASDNLVRAGVDTSTGELGAGSTYGSWRSTLSGDTWRYRNHFDAWIFEDALRHTARLEYAARWTELPLIVLAGLR